MSDFINFIIIILGYLTSFMVGYIYAAHKAVKTLDFINEQTEQFKLNTLCEIEKMRKIVDEHIEDTEEAKKFYYSQEH